MAEKIRIEAQPGPQRLFLSTPADIAIYGGAAGGGKTFALLMEPLRHIGNGQFGAVIFRRTYPQVRNEGGLWDEASKMYPLLGAKPRETTLEWVFPSGATVRFAHLQYEQNKLDWQGAQVPFFGFDELTHFSESQFFYMLSRNRSTCGVRPYVRATTNPDVDSWVAKLIAWWIDQATGLPIPIRAGQVRWFVRVHDQLHWADTPGELSKYGDHIEPKSLTFIPARVQDNPALLAQDPGYLANLQALPLVDMERLLYGNWKVRPEAGKVFNRAWFGIVPAPPAGGVECRNFDFAATEKKQKGKDPDFTAGVKIRKIGGISYVVDCVADQVGPAEGDELLINTTVQDALAARSQGVRYKVRWEQEGGSSGIKESRRLVGILHKAFAEHGLSLDAMGVPPEGDKLTRAKAMASNARVGNVRLVAGPWNEQWLSHMHGQPDLPHDDIMDASAGAFNELAGEAAGVAVAPGRVVQASELFG